jgi:hypothetical protein
MLLIKLNATFDFLPTVWPLSIFEPLLYTLRTLI